LQRSDQLQQIITPVDGIQVGGYIENRGIDLYRLAKEKGLEGIIAKRKTSIYGPGKRSLDWLKIKSRPQQESLCAASLKEKGVASILAHCYWARIETGSYATSVTPVPDLVRKDWQKQSID